jgi:tRNA pseudouridine55 synthase
VYWLDVAEYAWPVLTFDMACGRGTYVRAVIRDIGMALSTGGCLTTLTRTRVGPFTADSAWTLEALAQLPDVAEAVLPLEAASRLVGDPASASPPPRPGPAASE